MAENFDDMFEQYAARIEKKSFKGGDFQQRVYETIEWTGLEKNKAKIIRVVGDLPDTEGSTPDTAKTVVISWIIGDDGKKFKVVRPSNAEDPTYILNRIISKVTKASWNNGVKSFPVKDNYPDIYNIVDKNGLAPTDNAYKYERGWKGQEVIIMNVIDRAQMDWHRANKHTMLLANNVSISTNGVAFPQEGISSASAGPRLVQLFGGYGLWDKYDIAITKTGNKDNPLIITNATHSPMEVADKSARPLISNEDHLTDEEKSWERYDLQKLYKPTSYTKILNHLRNTIKRIDKVLDTDFVAELEEKAAAEKEEWKKLYGDDSTKSTESSAVETVEPLVEDAVMPITETRAREEVETRSSGKQPWEELPYGSELSDELKAGVQEVIKDADGKITNIIWDKKFRLMKCDGPNCSIPSPSQATCCPVCGKQYS